MVGNMPPVYPAAAHTGGDAGSGLREQHGAESFADDVVVPNAQAFCAVSTYVPGTSAATEQRLDLLRQYYSDEWKPVAMCTMWPEFRRSLSRRCSNATTS
jgi:hypothetical protein